MPPAIPIKNMVPCQPIISPNNPPEMKLKIGTTTMIPLIKAKAPAASSLSKESLMMARMMEMMEPPPNP